MSDVPRSAPVPRAVRAALAAGTPPPADAFAALDDDQRRVVHVYVRLRDAHRPAAQPPVRKVLDR